MALKPIQELSSTYLACTLKSHLLTPHLDPKMTYNSTYFLLFYATPISQNKFKPKQNHTQHQASSN